MKKITSESLFGLKNVSQSIAWKNTIFYLETQIDKKENLYRTAIKSLDRTTKQRRDWGDTGSVNTAIKISPNNKWLAYLSNGTKDKKMQLMVMPLDGGSPFQLTEDKEGVSTYYWTNSGASIYYQTAAELELEEEINGDKKDSQSDTSEKLPEATNIKKLTYKLDGVGILPQNQNHHVKKIDIATKSSSTILTRKESFALNYVAKDESYLIYADELNPEDEWDYGATVYWYDLATKESHSLTTSIPQGSFSFGAMSPKEDYLLLVGNDFEYAFVSQNKLYGYDLSSHQLTCLTPNEDLEVSDTLVGDFQQQVTGIEPVWLDDEEYLFSATEHGKIKLYKGNRSAEISLVFDEPMHLTDGSLVPDTQTMVVTYSTTSKPSELGLLDLKTKKIELLYNPNESFDKEHTIVQPEMFWYKGADDWDIQGWYLAPLERTDSHSAVLYIHGGPQVSYGETFFHEMQVLAAKGYGVIMLNPRGGNGYGQEFVASILGDYGNKDFEDLMLGTDTVLAAHPEINPKELYVSGGSYGGFMTNWVVGHTDRFKAAVTQRSISNWISFYGTSDIGPFFVKFQLQHDLSNVEKLWGMSPLSHAHQAKTPILIMHSDEDLRCPKEQGEQFYTAMKRQGVDTKFMTFPKSSHGLSRIGLPNLRIQRMEAVVDWFETH
ncbi:S9 family peptidase [Desemzia sp. RIT804]|uniref:S9 family peptidase n=1 Tax=Desemzia sp. RIT 804 TaxID=2810209 RepID=UPI001951D8A4|nr:S9 family peptidase [Desemzia sp. RIT 804]MBM6615520.1 S9 family peptidase [Desemzia sp. RIT 804]